MTSTTLAKELSKMPLTPNKEDAIDRLEDFTPELEDLSQPPHFEGIIALFYGTNGVGKTWLGGTIGPRGLILNIGSGLTTLKSKLYRDAIPPDQRPKVITIYEDLDPATKLFKDAVAWAKVENRMSWFLEHPDFDTLVVDDASFLNTFARNKAIIFNSSTGESMTWNKVKIHKFVSPAVQDYGTEMELLETWHRKWVPQFRFKGKNLVVLAHQRLIYKAIKNERGKPEQVLDSVKPAFTGKSFPDTIPNYYDIVWHLTVSRDAKGSPTFKSNTVGDNIITAKNRWGGIFEDKLTTPKFTELEAKIKAYIKQEEEKKQ